MFSIAPRIIDLVDELTTIRPEQIVEGALGRVLQDATIHYSTLDAYLYWSPGRYTRNLLYRTNDFELLALCWDAGSSSPIHDHGGQRCYMRVISGAFDVEDFERIEGGREPGPMRLASLGLRRLAPGELDSLDASRDIHRVAPAGGRSISLHIYARPLDRAMLYEAQVGRCRYAYLRYDAIRGEAFERHATA